MKEPLPPPPTKWTEEEQKTLNTITEISSTPKDQEMIGRAVLPTKTLPQIRAALNAHRRATSRRQSELSIVERSMLIGFVKLYGTLWKELSLTFFSGVPPKVLSNTFGYMLQSSCIGLSKEDKKFGLPLDQSGNKIPYRTRQINRARIFLDFESFKEGRTDFYNHRVLRTIRLYSPFQLAALKNEIDELIKSSGIDALTAGYVIYGHSQNTSEPVSEVFYNAGADGFYLQFVPPEQKEDQMEIE
jgi:hypothetical protein